MVSSGTELDNLIERSLRAFAVEVLHGDWSGRREREAVSLFVLGYLLRETMPDSVLHDATQVGIEVPVPQVEKLRGTLRSKSQICKDIVMWPERRMTCWGPCGLPTVAPLCIIEWKHFVSRGLDENIRWLQSFTARYPECTGYAVLTEPPNSEHVVQCTRVAVDGTIPSWLVIDRGSKRNPVDSGYWLQQLCILNLN